MNSAVRLAALAAEAGQQAARLVVAAARAPRRCGTISSSFGQRLERAAQLVVLQPARRAGVDRGLERVEVGRDRASETIVSPTTLRARSGWISRRRDARLSTTLTSSSSRTPSRFQRSRIRRTPRSASTSGVVTTSTWPAISAAIAVASVATAPMSTTVSAWRALTALRHVAGDGGVDVLGLLALLGREQQPEAVLVRVERLLQVADGDLVGDDDEVDDAAPVRRVQQRAEIALLEVEVDQADRPAGRHPRRGHAEVQRDRGRADAALGARDDDELAAERRARGLLAGDAVAHRPRPLRGRADAGLEGLERERQRDDVAQAGLHRRAQQARRVLGGEQDQPDLGERGRRARARGRAPACRRARRAAGRRRRPAGAARGAARRGR